MDPSIRKLPDKVCMSSPAVVEVLRGFLDMAFAEEIKFIAIEVKVGSDIRKFSFATSRE